MVFAIIILHLTEMEHGSSFIHHSSEVLVDLKEISHSLVTDSASTVNSTFSFLSPISDAIPLVSVISKMILLITEAIIKVSDNWKLANMSEMMVTLNCMGLDKMAETIARQMTFTYQEQIKLLSPEGAKQFAEFGALRILILLLNGRIDSQTNLVNQIVKAVGDYSIKINRQKIEFLQTEINLPSLFYLVKLSVKNSQDPHVDQDLLYHSAGRCLRISDKKYFWSKGKKNGAESSPATLAGYVRVNTLDDIPENMTMDSQRLGPPSKLTL